ncbi:phage minor capsid protein [Brotaphodocola sp.]|uniref:phage minor capsid protein n=1 Tax=Brotaphodocola sp. TaxID=3073577 RepID=UPI003D7E36DA
MARNEYDITTAFQRIEDELIASMIRNMDRHRAEETAEGYEWSMWQTEQLKALEKYKRDNQKKYQKQFRNLNTQIEDLIREARRKGGMDQEIQILEAIKKGWEAPPRQKMTGEFFRLNNRKLEALIEATVKDMEKAETAILRKANDDYRKAIFDAQVYANSGAGTYKKAVDMATKDMLSRGLNCVEYSNGARHTLPDYADMAIRTANKRAYLQGEGEKRQEWDIHTVIMAKRGNPCPKCLPFVGKVLIDDVWSNGSGSGNKGIDPETGKKYPLMSYAISKGLYHPRCKDSHTTYFPGISSADDTWTQTELEDIGLQNQQEAQQQYAERQEEKYKRLSEYSLDAKNKLKYTEREKEWSQIVRECGHRGRNKSTVMNRKEITSNRYRRKVYTLPEDKSMCRTIASEMINIIKQRSGTEYESLVFINTETKEVKRSLEMNLRKAVAPTNKMKKMLKSAKEYSIIGIHNHPGSSVPSWSDIEVASMRRYKYGLIAAHDGTIFKYKIIGKINRIFYDAAVAKLDKTGYTERSLKEFCIEVGDAGVEMEVL